MIICLDWWITSCRNISKQSTSPRRRAKRAETGCTKSPRSGSCYLVFTLSWQCWKVIPSWRTRKLTKTIRGCVNRGSVGSPSFDRILHELKFMIDTYFPFRWLCRDFSSALIRLSKAIRGVGNPLVAAYCRCYLMRVGREKFITDHSFVIENVNDLLLSYHQVDCFICFV